MQEQENAQIKTEISPQHGIIDIILLQNKLLLKEISRLTNEESPKEKIFSNIDFRKVAPEVFSSNADFCKAVLQVFSSYPNFGEAVLQAFSSYPNFREAVLQVFSSYPNFREAVLQAFSSYPNFREAILQVFSSYPNFGEAVPEVISSYADSDKQTGQNQEALPPFIEPTPTVVGNLGWELSYSEMRNVKRKGLRNTALILLQAHNGQSCSHKDLRKLTGLSEGGIAKMMMSLKKRGLIYRTGFKRFALSEKAQQMLGPALVVKPWSLINSRQKHSRNS